MDKNKDKFIQERVSNLEKVCMPVVEFIKDNYDPHTTVVITDNQIKLVRDEIGIPVKEAAPEVPVQKQGRKFVPEDSNGLCKDLKPCNNSTQI